MKYENKTWTIYLSFYQESENHNNVLRNFSKKITIEDYIYQNSLKKPNMYDMIFIMVKYVNTLSK